MRSSALVLPFLALASACAAANPATPPGASAPANALVAASPAAPPDAEHPRHRSFPPTGPSVKVTLGGVRHKVDVVAVASDAGAPLLPVLALVRAAWPNEDSSSLHFDFVGSDGFRPTSKPKCAHLLTASDVAHLRMDPTTHDLSFDSVADFPPCYRVHAVVQIDATR